MVRVSGYSIGWVNELHNNLMPLGGVDEYKADGDNEKAIRDFF